MNKHDMDLGGREAKLLYLSGDYDVLKPGEYVLCAITGARIPVSELRYWSYEVQEAYASAAIMLARHKELADEGKL